MLPLIALICVVASCTFSYLLQKNCNSMSIRFRGKKIEAVKKMVVAEVHDIFMENGQYYANCMIQGISTPYTVAIDKAMMAAMPDQDSDVSASMKKVLLYEVVSSDGVYTYALTPEEIRFKTKLKVLSSESKTKEDIQDASSVIGLYYEIRLVLWTLAWVGIYRSPMLSILFSSIAAWISWRNLIPFRYTLTKKCGIINTKNNGSTPSQGAPEPPPGYDNWSEESKYMYALEQKVVRKQGDVVSEAEKQPGEEDTPFFTDEELSAEETHEEAEALNVGIEDDDADNGFDADEFEADAEFVNDTSTSVELENAPSQEKLEVAETFGGSHCAKNERKMEFNKSTVANGRKRTQKKNTLADKLNDLAGSEEE